MTAARAHRAHPLADLTTLDVFAGTPFAPGTSPTRRTFYSPVDDVHAVLVKVIGSATQSLVLAMYGFDDDELAEVIDRKLADEHLYVQLTLDSSQAAGVHERRLLEAHPYPASTVAVGRSERGAIMHLKEAVVDGVVHLTGSTNWSTAGETKQDNELTVVHDPYACARATARIGAIHANMLAKAHARARA